MSGGPTVLNASDALGWLKIWCERPLMFLTLSDDRKRPRVDAAQLLLDGYLTAKPNDQSLERFEVWARKRLPADSEGRRLSEAILLASDHDDARAVAALLEMIKSYEGETQVSN